MKKNNMTAITASTANNNVARARATTKHHYRNRRITE